MLKFPKLRLSVNLHAIRTIIASNYNLMFPKSSAVSLLDKTYEQTDHCQATIYVTLEDKKTCLKVTVNNIACDVVCSVANKAICSL